MSKFKFSAAALCILLVAGGCGGGTEETDAAGEDGEDGMFDSPIADYLGFDDVDFDSDDLQDEINSQIVSCMQAEGFEWIPSDEGQFDTYEAEPDGLEYGSEEYVAKYGFGYSTQRFSQQQVGPNLVGHTWDEEVDVSAGGAFAEDPNDEYVNALTDAERDAYYKALWGMDDGPEVSEEMTDEEVQEAFDAWNATRVVSGCEPKAQEEAYGGGIAQAFYEEFGGDMEGIYEDMQADPRIVAANRKLADCVTDKGLQFTNMEDVYEDFQERMEPLEEATGSMDFGDLAEEDLEAMSEDELEAQFDSFVAPEFDDATKDLLGEIQADEIALATAVFECGGSDYYGGGVDEDLFQEVYAETEQRYLDENQGRIDAFKAEYEAENSGS